MLGHHFTCEQIFCGLRGIKFYKLPSDPSGFLPAYTRNDFTDSLHDAFGFRTDYEIITRSDMKKILSLTKKK